MSEGLALLYANVIQQHADWGAEYFMDRGFRGLGHRVTNVDFRANRDRLAATFLGMRGEYDGFFLQRGDRFPKQVIRAMHGPRVFWATELVARNRDQDRLLRSGLFDFVYVHSAACRSTVLDRGWLEPDRVGVLLNGFDEAYFHGGQDHAKDIDVLFIGNLLARRRAWIEALRTRFRIETPRAYGREMSAWIRRAKIVLNIHAEDFLDTETRVFEVLGSGGFLVSEQLSEENPFIAGRHFIAVDGLDAMADAISTYLARRDAREAVASAGQAEALRAHTYRARAAQVAETFTALRARGPRLTVDVDALRGVAARETIRRAVCWPWQRLRRAGRR